MKIAKFCKYDKCQRRTTAPHGFCWQHKRILGEDDAKRKAPGLGK